MSTRKRLTWKQGGERTAHRLPVEEADRRASAHPAVPDEGITHPAGYSDPEQPDAYENGDTSSWAEDPHPGPYENSAHPATPDEGPFHPAAKKAAQELRAAVERKALKCLRIATATLGKDASIKEIEAQSLSMMDLPNAYIDSTLARLAKKSEDTEEEAAEPIQDEEGEEEETKKASRRMSADDRLLRRLLAEEGMDDDDDDGSDKEASDDRLAAIESSLAAMTKELQAMRGMNVAQDDDEVLLAQLLAEDESDEGGMDEEAMLAQMLEDEMAVGVEDEDEALLAQMLEDEMAVGVEDEDEALLAQMLEDERASVVMASEDTEEDAEEDAEEEGSDKEATLGDYIADTDVDLSVAEDPMGLGGDDLGDMSVLANLYTAKKAEDDEDEDDEEAEEEAEEAEEEAEEAEDDKGSGKKAASRKPRPKKASSGARTVGQPNFDKTASSEINDLARLWKAAPDVSEVF